MTSQPMYGYNSSRPIKFREASTTDGVQLYYLDDEEVEFEKIINQPLPKIPREVEFIGTPRSAFGLVCLLQDIGSRSKVSSRRLCKTLPQHISSPLNIKIQLLVLLDPLQ